MSLLASIRASLSLETAQFEAGAKKARRTAATTSTAINKSLSSIKNFGAGFLSALSVGLLTRGIKAALDYAGSLAEVAQQLGVTTRQLQVYRYAAGQVGVSQEQLEKGLEKLNTSLGKAKLGAKAPAEAFGALSKIIGKDIVAASKQGGDALPLVADGLSKITDRSKRAAVEVALFSRAGSALDPLLSGGSRAINELAAAADKLGIVLSGEAIRNADDTADKLEAVRTVLAANIAGVVAQNSQAIVGLASSLGQLTGKIIQFLNSNPQAALAIIGALSGARVGGLPGAAVGAIAGAEIGSGPQARADQRKLQGNTGLLRHNLQSVAASIRAKRKAGQTVTVGELNRLKRLTDKLNSATGRGPAPFVPVGAEVDPFLASGGGGGKGKKDNSAAEAERLRKQQLRDAYQFAQDQRRADLDIISAKRDLSVSTDEQARLNLEALQIEHEGNLAEIQFNQDMGDISETQAQILVEKENTLNGIRREAVLAEQMAQKLEDEDRMIETLGSIRRDEIQARLDLAQTSDERRRISLELLDFDYQEKKLALQRIVANTKLNEAVRARAQAELNALPAQQSLDRERTIQGTRGPMEEWLANAQNTTDAMESLKVQGIEGAIDALTHLTEGFNSFRDAAVAALKDVIAQLIRIQLMKMAASIFGGATGGFDAAGFGSMASSNLAAIGAIPMNIPSLGFAGGGGFTVRGLPGIDKNVLSVNGQPIAGVSNNERIRVDNIEKGMGGGSTTVNFAITGPVSRETMGQIAAKTKLAIATANRKGM